MEILANHLYDFETEPVLVVSIVDDTVICVKATSSATEKDWLLVPVEKFAALAKHRGEFLKRGTYENNRGEEFATMCGPIMLCELSYTKKPSVRLNFFIHEMYQAIHVEDPELKFSNDVMLA